MTDATRDDAEVYYLLPTTNPHLTFDGIERAEAFARRKDGRQVIPVVPKSALDAATARAEQAEAALCEMREVFGEVIDWQGIDHEDDDCPEDDTCECKLVAKVNAVFKSAPGKSTADELRRLREFSEQIRQAVDTERLSLGERYTAVVIALRLLTPSKAT